MSFGGLCLLALAARAEAAEPRRRFNIPQKPYAEALIDLAVQANVSLLGSQSCGDRGNVALSGTYTLNEALTRLLAGAACTYRIVDARTVRVLPAPPPPGAPAPRPQSGGPATLLTELMITARRRPERLDTLPAGVSVVSSDQLRAYGAGDTRDTAGQLVGVTMTNLGPGRDKLLMRGLSDGAFTGRARSTVGTYLDDVPINYNAPDPDLRLVDMERVETVRGPQGALYGSGALAGVYRLVTNKPDPDRFEAGGQAIVSTTQGGSASYEADAFANLPLGAGRSALRLVIYRDDQGGYLDNVSLRLSNVDSTLREGGRAALRLPLGDRWTLDIAAVAQRLHSRDTQYTTLGTGSARRANQVREASDNDFAEGALNLRGELGWADVTASSSYVQHAYSSLYDATAAASQFSDTGSNLGIYSESARIRRFVQDVALTSPGDGPVGWLAGIYASRSMERTPSSLDILASTTPVIKGKSPPLTRVYDEDRRDSLNELAAYGEGTWRFAPGWTASGGLRVFKTELGVRATIAGTPPTEPRAVDLSRDFSGVSSKLSVQYAFASGAMTYALYSEGFRPGGVNSTNFLTVRPERTTFEPDRLRNLEIGAKARFLDRRLILRAATFYDIWSGIQSDQYRTAGLAYTANVGDAVIKGLEAETAYEWSFGLSVQANVLYSDARITRVNLDFFRNNPVLALRLGSGLPGAPRLSGGLLARYERDLPRGLRLRLAGEANYVGPARLTFDPTLSARTDAVVNAQLLAEVAARAWSLGLFVTNPLNSSSDTFAYGNPFTFGQVRQVTPQRPRTIGLRLTAAF